MTDDKSKKVRGWEVEKVRKHPQSESRNCITFDLSPINRHCMCLPTNQLNKLNKPNQLISEPRSRSPFAECDFTGCIFGDMLFQFFTPQGLKCSATAIQRIHPGKVRLLAQQITENNLTGRNSRIFCQILKTFECQDLKCITQPG